MFIVVKVSRDKWKGYEDFTASPLHVQNYGTHRTQPNLTPKRTPKADPGFAFGPLRVRFSKILGPLGVRSESALGLLGVRSASALGGSALRTHA